MAVLNFFTEPTNIFDCLQFVQWQQFVLCCSGFCRMHGRYIISKWSAFYSLGFASCAVLGLSYTIYAKVNNVEQESRLSALDNLLLSIVCLELVMSTCVFIITTVSMQYHARRHIAIIERINALDQRLIQEFGANLNYRKLMRKDIMVMAVITAAYFGAVNSAIMQISEGDWPLTFMGTWCYAVITGGPHFSGFVHMNMTEVLRIRFRLLQRIINRDFLLLRFPDMVLRERRLYGAIDLVKEFHEVIREVNAVYMLSLISALAHDFTLTTSELYMIFGSKNFSPKILVYVVLCMLPPFYKIVMAPIYCHKAITEGQKCFNVIQKADEWFPESKLIRKMVSCTMFWRMKNKIQFQIGLNIVINKHIMTTVTSIVFNYLLILMQFRMTQEMGDQIEQQKNTLQEWIGVEF